MHREDELVTVVSGGLAPQLQIPLNRKSSGWDLSLRKPHVGLATVRLAPLHTALPHITDPATYARRQDGVHHWRRPMRGGAGGRSLHPGRWVPAARCIGAVQALRRWRHRRHWAAVHQQCCVGKTLLPAVHCSRRLCHTAPSFRQALIVAAPAGVKHSTKNIGESEAQWLYGYA